MLNLHDILKNGCSKAKNNEMNGYKLDKELSNHNNQINYN